MYRMFAKDYRVYVFSCKNKLEPGYTTMDMAADLKQAMDMLGIPKADIFGVSQGGMIAQHFAINYPEAVGKLVLAVTSARPNAYIEKVLPPWIAMAKRDAFHELMVDLKMYSEYGHALYEEAKDFNDVVFKFLGELKN